MPARRRRVLWLTKGLGPGGAERLLVTHASVADPRRIEYEAAYLLPHKDHLVADLESRGVLTHGLDAPNPLDPRWLRRFRQLVVEGDFDIVHAHSPAPAAPARLVVRSLPAAVRPAFVYTEHNRWPSHDRFTRSANQATFGLNDATIAVSDEVRASIDRRHRRAVDVIVHGIDVTEGPVLAAGRAATRAELGIAADRFVVVTVANFRASKGYPDLLAAAAQVVRRDPSVLFLIVGQGPLDAEVRAEVDRLDLADHVVVLGYRPDAARITAAADVFALASHHEGLPVAVMEAFAAGVPVVATDVGGLSEVVESGTSGLLVPVGRPDRLADALVELAGDAARRAALARGAAASAPRFSAARSAAEIDAVYDRALTAGALRSTGRARRR